MSLTQNSVLTNRIKNPERKRFKNYRHYGQTLNSFQQRFFYAEPMFITSEALYTDYNIGK